jgi:hypothetical protein
LTLQASEAPAHDDDGLETPANSRSNHGGGNGPAAGGTLVAEPRVRITAETNLEGVRAFIEPVGVGDTLIDMPLYLHPGRYVAVPLEETYWLAFESLRRRWRAILEPK